MPVTMLRDGRLIGYTDEVHRKESRTWPVRSVVKNTHLGWMECERCGREFRVWIVADATWRKIPRPWRRCAVCTRCFRALMGRS